MSTKSSKAWRESFLEAEREQEKLEYKSIIDRPYLTPLEIWTITETNFMLWRRKHDYPRILNFFSENLEGFEDWKKAFAIDNSFLMSYGICNCISLHVQSKSDKYIIEEEWNGQKSRTLSLQNLHNKNSQMGPYPVTRQAIKSFQGYLDWAESKKLKVHKEFRNRELLRGGTGKTSPGSPGVEVTVLDRMPLLKIGGLKVPTNQFGMINTKYFELVNADCLELEGRLSTKSKVLVFESSSLDNLYCEKMDLSLVKVSNCSMEDANIIDSNIQQWEFIRSRVTGKLVNSDFALCNVFGGQFYLDFKGSTINRSEARASRKTEISFEQTYRNFKQLYANQGEDAKAVEYFLLEKQILRLKLLGELLKPQIGFNYKVNALVKLFVGLKYRAKMCLRLLGLS